MISEQEYNNALNIIKEFENQIVDLTDEDEFFVGMNFTCNLNYHKTKCVVTKIEKREYNFDGNTFITTLITFDGIYKKDYKQSWSLSISQLLGMESKWNKPLELAKKRNNKLSVILND